MTAHPLIWLGFSLFVLAVLALDLGVFHRKAHAVGFKEALSWTGVWVTLAVLFGAGVWHWAGPQKGLEFFTGYKTLPALGVVAGVLVVTIVASLACQHRAPAYPRPGPEPGQTAEAVPQEGLKGEPMPRIRSRTKLAPGPTFSEELRQLASHFDDRPATLAAILKATQGRGFDLLLVLICLPFLTPIPLVGLSTPFGLVVFLIGARLALGRRPWLPRRLLEQRLPRGFITRFLSAASRVLRWLEVLLRPRLGFLHDQVLFRRVSGALIMVSGLLLLLPVPVPFTNTLPAITVILLAAGAMERDGVFFLVGCGLFALTASYFGLLAFGGAQAVDGLRHALSGG